jgi:hypothetical protein
MHFIYTYILVIVHLVKEKITVYKLHEIYDDSQLDSR